MNALEKPRELTLSILAEVAEVTPDDLEPHHRLREDLGLDSLTSLELLSRLGEALKMDLEFEQAMDIRTVDDACLFVERQCSVPQ
ncbi:MAG: acyl carrier protein [Myxococcales bacterium]|jgi:acyl carrier protein|nr:acyl carrier protein [Myxococcales bacterium]